MDPKMLQGMDSKLLQSMGVNLKAFGRDCIIFTTPLLYRILSHYSSILPLLKLSCQLPLYSTLLLIHYSYILSYSSVTSLLFSSTQPTTTTTPVVMPTTQRSGNCAHGISSKWEDLQIEEDASTPSISRASQSSVKPKGSTEVWQVVTWRSLSWSKARLG